MYQPKTIVLMGYDQQQHIELIRQARLKRETSEWEVRNNPAYVLVMAILGLVAFVVIQFPHQPLPIAITSVVILIVLFNTKRITSWLTPASIIAAKKEIAEGNY